MHLLLLLLLLLTFGLVLLGLKTLPVDLRERMLINALRTVEVDLLPAPLGDFLLELVEFAHVVAQIDQDLASQLVHQLVVELVLFGQVFANQIVSSRLIVASHLLNARVQTLLGLVST